MSKNDQIDDGGPAFPAEATGHPSKGMSLRDWFAGQALGIAYRSFSEVLTDKEHRVDLSLDGICGDDGISIDASILAEYAYSMADAMLKTRKSGVLP